MQKVKQLDRRRRIEHLRSEGQALAAYDETLAAISRDPDDLSLKQTALVLLARLGAIDLAQARAAEWRISGRENADAAGLIARLKKARALAMKGSARTTALAEAAAAYEDAASRFSSDYLHVNAATLYALSGRMESARESALRAVAISSQEGEQARYWRKVTMAEAHLVLGGMSKARQLVSEAAGTSPNLSDRAATCLQLELLIDVLGLDPAILVPLRPPLTVHYTGNRFVVPSEHSDILEDLEGKSESIIRDKRIGFGFGSLSAGADIVLAEAILSAGGTVRAILPAPLPVFLAQSIAPCGTYWTTRFERLVSRSATRTEKRFSFDVITDDHGQLTDTAYIYASRLAIGLAVAHARAIAGSAEQIAVWDGATASEGRAGTGSDVAAWRSFQIGPTTTIPFEREGPQASRYVPMEGQGLNSTTCQMVAAILFGDFVGFSRLREDEVLVFEDAYMRTIADLAARHVGSILFSNTWGDALHMVFSDSDSAAEFALDLQERLEQIDFRSSGLAVPIQLRLACHFGPIYGHFNAIRQARGFCGTHISRCARIEPVAIPGKVFVSEAFMAEISLTSPARFRCEYVGKMETAKGYGKLPMYLLVRGQEDIVSQS